MNCMKYSYITTTVVGQKLVLLLGLNGISAELLVGDNPIAFLMSLKQLKQFTYRRYYILIDFRDSSEYNMENPIRLGYVGIYVCMNSMYVKLYRY